MPTHVDDRTQVLLVSLKTEAQLLKSWMARRADVAQRRRDGPADALRHRIALLEKELPRLAREVAGQERSVNSHAKPRPPLRSWLGGFARGVGLIVSAALFVVSMVAVTASSRIDDPLRLATMLSVIAVVALCRRSRS